MLKKLKLLFLDTSLFRLCYMMFMFFWMVKYIEKVTYIIIAILFIWGLALSIYSIVVRKAVKRLYFSLWLVLFMVSFVITILLNINGDPQTVLFNLFMLMNCSVCFFVFYGMHIEKGVVFRWELYLVARIFVYLSTLLSLIGLILMFFTQGQFESYMQYKGEVYSGFFTNPNYQGFVSAISIIFCHMLTKPSFIANSGQKRVSRIWLVCCVLFNVISLLLCDSMASLVLIVGYVAVYIVIKLFSMVEELNAKRIATRVVVLILAGGVLVFLMIFLRDTFRIGVVSMFSGSEGADPETLNQMSKPTIFNLSEDTGVRSRMRLWTAGFDIFLQNPIFGIGKGNLYNSLVDVSGSTHWYSEQYEGFGRIIATDLHSGFFTILVTAGIIGFVLFTIFTVRVIMMAVPVWFVQRRIMTYSVYPCLLAFLVAYLFYSLVERTVLFDPTFIVMSFWLLLGYTVCYALDFGYRRDGNCKHKLIGYKIPKRLI